MHGWRYAVKEGCSDKCHAEITNFAAADRAEQVQQQDLCWEHLWHIPREYRKWSGKGGVKDFLRGLSFIICICEVLMQHRIPRLSSWGAMQRRAKPPPNCWACPRYRGDQTADHNPWVNPTNAIWSEDEPAQLSPALTTKAWWRCSRVEYYIVLDHWYNLCVTNFLLGSPTFKTEKK